MKKIILFFFVLVFALFSSINNVNAEEIGVSGENKVANQKKEINSDEIKKNSISKSSIEDIFGDEQTFPFVAGLGKNAAH